MKHALDVNPGRRLYNSVARAFRKRPVAPSDAKEAASRNTKKWSESVYPKEGYEKDEYRKAATAAERI